MPRSPEIRVEGASNAAIARVFDEMADLLEIEDANPFRVRAYRNAARLIEGLGVSLAEMLARGEDPDDLPGIGKDLAAKIAEIVRTGTCQAHEELRRRLPPTITTLLRVPGLGPRRVQTLHRSLDISTPAQLRAAAEAGRIRALPGFGEKTEAAILQALGAQADSAQRFLLAVAAQYAEPLRAWLAQTPGVGEVVIAGSYRRAKETVGDLDVLATAARSEAVTARFCAYPEVRRVLARGDTRSTVVLANGLQVDLRVVPRASFGAALYYFTGSKAHNVAVRRIAQSRGLKINEYGVYRGKRRIAGDTEASVFATIGLPYIPPELRENRGEIEAAQAGTLPRLLTRADLQGDLHVYLPREQSELEALVRAARERGLRYLGLTLSARGGHGGERRDDFARLPRRLHGVTLLKALELEIAEDGGLNAPAELLAHCDFVIGALASATRLPRARQTRRVLRALEHPRLALLAHPTGRRPGRDGGFELDVPAVIRAARDRGCLLELNAQPERLDLPDVYCRLAKDEGARIAINSAAASAAELDYLGFGVGQARRGWLEAGDVVNTRPLGEVEGLLRRA
jgi:DNA polymerase (family 10)